MTNRGKLVVLGLLTRKGVVKWWVKASLQYGSECIFGGEVALTFEVPLHGTFYGFFPSPSSKTNPGDLSHPCHLGW